MALFPEGLSPVVVAVLIATAGITSLLTAATGAGGGVLLIAILAQVLPPSVIIPVHGVVQLGSNFGRAAMSWRHIDWRIVGPFLPGSLLGAIAGSLVLVRLPPRATYLTIAGFILLLSWGPSLPRAALGAMGATLTGALTTFLTLFAGATGPLVAAFVRQVHSDRFKTVATFAAAMTVQHSLKVVVFQRAGVDLHEWIPLVAVMLGTGAIGTWIGLRLLERMKDSQFHRIFDIALTLLAVRLIWQALFPAAP
jgi:uncharacterized membrane protein YfcA